MFRKKNIPAAAEEMNNEQRAAYTAGMRKAMLRSGIFAFLAFAVTVMATLAWFAQNRKTDSTGMMMEIEATSNLVISDSPEATEGGIKYSGILGLFDDMHTPDHVTMSAPANVVLAPASHYDSSIYTTVGGTDDGTDDGTGLVYNSNPSAVSYTTGYAKGSDEALAFSHVPTYTDSSKPRYYIDYTVYLASAGKSFDASKLNVTFDFTEEPDPMQDHFKASSVDFYLENTYAGTLNLADKDYKTGTALTTIDLTGTAASTTIPLNTEGYLTVTMRFYFDGALQKENGQAYVYSNALAPAKLDLTVAFEAVDVETAS